MKITVVTPRFALSGVPLAQIRLAKAFASQGHEVELIIGCVNQGFVVPNLPELKLTILGTGRVIHMLLPLYRHLQTAEPDVIFSAEDHLNFVVILAAILSGSKAKISGSCRVTPFDTYSNKLFTKRWVLKLVAKALMWRADALTCVSKDMVEQYRSIFPSCPHLCVYNIVQTTEQYEKMREDVQHPWFTLHDRPLVVAAGTLAYWKGFRDLIVAFQMVASQVPARLVILGDGPQRTELEELVTSLGLNDSVQLLGFQDNPLKYFRKADVFVLSSHVEGLPNVLVEAMMCGCTPVATNCPTGPKEVLQNGRIGYLVPMKNPTALAEGIVAGLKNPVQPALLNEAIEPFEETKILKRHFEILGISK